MIFPDSTRIRKGTMTKEEALAANHARTCPDCRRPRLATSKYVALRDVQHYCLRDYITVESPKPETFCTPEDVLDDCREIAAALRCHDDSRPADRFSIHPGLAIWDERLCWDGSFRCPIAVARAATIARCPSGLVVNGRAVGVGSVVHAGDVVEWSPTLLEGDRDDLLDRDDLWVEFEIQEEEAP